MRSSNKNSIEIKPETNQLTYHELLSDQPFYQQPIKKLRGKKLSYKELLQRLPFYDKVGILKKQKVFRNYFEIYKLETIDKKSLNDSLFLSKHYLITI